MIFFFFYYCVNVVRTKVTIIFYNMNRIAQASFFSFLPLFLVLTSPLLSQGRHLVDIPVSSSLNDLEEDSLDNELSVADGTTSVMSTKGDDQWVKISQGPPTVVTGSQGSRIELECEAIGSPAPSIYWLHESDENTRVLYERSFETNSILENPSKGLAKVRAKRVIYSARLEHAGQYTCVAKAGMHAATAKTNVIVTEASTAGPTWSKLVAARAKPSIVLHNSIYMNDIGSDLILPCRAIVPANAPHSSVTWFNPEERVIASELDKPMGGKQAQRLITLKNGSLQIRGVRWNDMGPYTCVASNENGHDSIITFLYPMLPEK